MPHPSLSPDRYYLLKLLVTLSIVIIVLSACLPQSREPSTENEPIQIDVIEETPTPILVATMAAEAIEPSPTASIQSTLYIPDVVPQVLQGQKIALDVITRTVSSVSMPEIAYEFSNSGRLVGMLSNDNRNYTGVCTP